MKVVIINSPLFRDKNEKYEEDSLPPIGLGLIATALEDRGVDVSLIDAVALNIPLKELISQVEKMTPDFICINIFSTNLILVKDFVESLKINSHLIVGGLSTKDLLNEIFSWNTTLLVDVVHGDGERIVPEIVFNNVQDKPLVEEKNRRFFSITRTSQYYVTDISGERLNRNYFVNEPIQHPFGFTEATLITSRGCIYNCAFCAAARSVNQAMGIREKSSESISAEIKQLIEIYPNLESIRVLDDLFLKSPKCIENAIKIFSPFQLQWRAMAHIETFKNVSPQTMQDLKRSGCNELFIGIESGSPKILRQIHKTHDIDKIKSSIAHLLKAGINVKGYFIFGFPNETLEDFELTHALAKYLKDESLKYGSKFRVSVFQYRPYHGTELYHSIQSNEKSGVNKIQNIEPDHVLSSKVRRLQFNFHSGNFSSEETFVVQDFIFKTMNLNSLSIFGGDGCPNRNP